MVLWYCSLGSGKRRAQPFVFSAANLLAIRDEAQRGMTWHITALARAWRCWQEVNEAAADSQVPGGQLEQVFKAFGQAVALCRREPRPCCLHLHMHNFANHACAAIAKHPTSSGV